MNVFQLVVEFFKVVVNGFRLFQVVVCRFMLLVTTILFSLLQSPCSDLPCKNKGKCVTLYKTNSYFCACKKIFTGQHCEKGEETKGTIGNFGNNEIGKNASKIEISVIM